MTALHEWAARQGSKPALIDAGTGTVIDYATLDRRSRLAARWLIDAGLQEGDGVALLLDNDLRMIELCWGARRAGLYFTAVNHHLTLPEVTHVLTDCGARWVVACEATRPLAAQALAEPALASVQAVLLDGPADDRFDVYEEALARQSDGPLPERAQGRDMLYSSGTTGFPKGIRRPLRSLAQKRLPDPEVQAWQRAFGFDDTTVYLSTAPFYHAAPLRYVMRVIETGGTAVSMARFDAQAALAAIDRHAVTHSQWVPTMFVRLLALPPEVRARASLATMRVAIHAAAPCPPHVKQAMLDWWGDIVHEFYGGSEGLGLTAIGPAEWRAHPGSVGRATLGVLHIVDDDGHELAPGEVGRIYFSGAASFAYHNDPEKTAAAYNDRGWATYGDLGHVDEDGYLYLSDRRVDLILCGGVNIYPQEIENVLSRQADVADVAVVGVDDDEFGQVVCAVVQVKEGVVGDAALAARLVQACRSSLGRLKLPRYVVFEEALPRLPTGKMLRRILKERYRRAGGQPGVFTIKP
ncbi:MAG: acyl-CoA synthetase [Comamonadaceae bacterium]|nr:MAG: acyl-CoA synthetase [Comamonadaceae bacterium]